MSGANLKSSVRKMKKPVIALDCDGVLLNYNLAYAHAWERAFDVYPAEKDPQAYWAIDRWDVELLSGERLDRFVACFDHQFWSTMQPLDKAIDACTALHEAGHELVCVSALAPQFAQARQRNLRDLGFPIERVIATGSASAGRSPKAQALEELQPVAFVDDYLPYLHGVHPEVHTALVLREPNGTPNDGPGLRAAKSQHADLSDFAQWWLAQG
jgi:phosphoglycolate phosphatase-like HAD superfamily hydrolase